MKYITIKKFSELTGYSENAVRAKLKKGIWVEHTHWRKAPDGRIMLSPQNIKRWIEGV